jgi:hypothetical protein
MREGKRSIPVRCYEWQQVDIVMAVVGYRDTIVYNVVAAVTAMNQ